MKGRKGFLCVLIVEGTLFLPFILLYQGMFYIPMGGRGGVPQGAKEKGLLGPFSNDYSTPSIALEGARISVLLYKYLIPLSIPSQ